ncbi:glycosyltransferase family 15 protein [Cunninghamella echinulata]|nr:glycosyltransferase family 15 protein [Cunninghamella echinulata]
MIVSNEDLNAARETIRYIEDRFNHQHHYPWILLNYQYFRADFKKYIQKATSSPVYFGKIDPEAWNYPNWIDVSRAEKSILELFNLYKGDSMSYHQQLRYQAGLFFHHPLFKNVEYAWRVEPGSHYSCDIDIDPFGVMKKENKKLGFVIAMQEESDAITTLWPTTKLFIENYPQYIKPTKDTIMSWIIENDNGGDMDDAYYNNCHIWTNFEIVDLSFLRSKEYQLYFNHLDKAGGFFYEKWGDTIHTLAAAMFLDKSQVHFFDQIGYSKSDISHCPINPTSFNKCTCDPKMLLNWNLVVRRVK